MPLVEVEGNVEGEGQRVCRAVVLSQREARRQLMVNFRTYDFLIVTNPVLVKLRNVNFEAQYGL